MGSIPASIPPDVVPLTASLPLGNAVGPSGADDGTAVAVAGGFGALFAVQISNASIAPADMTAAPEAGELVSSEVPTQVVIAEKDALGRVAREEIGEDIPADSASGQLLDLVTYTVDVAIIPPVISPPTAPVAEVAASDVSGTWQRQATLGSASTSVGLADAAVRVAVQDTRLVTTTASVVAGVTIKAPALSDVMQDGLVVSDSSPEPAPTSLNTIEQLPRNGRPVEAQPDRMSYFASMPPSPLQSQAQLEQTLSSAALEVDSEPPLAAATAGTASVSVAVAVPVPASSPAPRSTKSPITPDAMASSPSLSTMNSGSVPQSTPVVHERAPEQNPSDVAPLVSSTLLSPPLGAVSASSRTNERNREALVSDLHTDTTVSSGADEDVVIPVIPTLPADQPTSLMRTHESSPVSEQARMEDPLRLAEPTAGRDQTAPSAASSATPSAAAIPFALGAAAGGTNTTPTALPNPLERNIARQLTQQLSAPLATLTTTGASRKSAADKSLIIRLTPPELGTVRIEISQRDGQLTVRMHAEDPAVRQAIERMLPTLRSDLRQTDSPLHQITVESSGDGSRGGDRGSDRGADDRGSWQGQQQQHQQRHEHRLNGDVARPVFSLSGMPAPEPVVAIPRSRSLGGRSSMTGVDALA